MKLNLGCGTDIRHGYVNIDRIPQGQAATGTYKQGDIKSLDWLVEDGSVDEIVAIDCLEYIATNCVEPAIANWVQKLSVGGVLKIMVPDCYAIAKAFVLGQFGLPEYSRITFGAQDGKDTRLSVIDTLTLLTMLKNAGLTISLKRYEGVAVYVEAIK